MRGIAAAALVLSGCLALTSHDDPFGCIDDSNCSGGTTCQQLKTSQGPVCVPPGYCGGSADCPLATSSTNWTGATNWPCVNHSCVAPPCGTDSNCTAYACRNSFCLGSCGADTDCQEGYICSGGACVIHSCAYDSDCGAYTCNQYSPSKHCGISCAVDFDCNAGNLCTNGKCGPWACTVGVLAACDGFFCVNGVCNSRCASSSECEPGLSCSQYACSCDPSSKACGAYVCRGSGCLTSCTSNSDCSTGHACQSGHCVGCEGTAAACADQGTCHAPGCTSSLGCIGGNIDCSQFNNAQNSCTLVVGCTWNASSNSCTGSTSCGAQYYSLCPTAYGCAQGNVCTGTPTACSALSVTNCTNTLGCAVQ